MSIDYFFAKLKRKKQSCSKKRVKKPTLKTHKKKKLKTSQKIVFFNYELN